VFFYQHQRGYEISDIRGLFNRDNMERLRWARQGKMIYGNKDEIQVLAAQQLTNLADVNSKEARTSSDSYYLDFVSNVLRNFGDVKDVFDFAYYYDGFMKEASDESENISISTHNKNIKDFVKQIKTADQIIFADSEISRVTSLILQNGGSHVRLQDAISNRVINLRYDKSNLPSIKIYSSQMRM